MRTYERALDILARVESMPGDTTGALCFGKARVLVQGGAICWAVAPGSPVRLTDLLRSQRHPPLSRDELEACYRRCRDSGQPVGEGLLAAGLVSAQGLRQALFAHTTEGIAQIAQAEQTYEGFVPHQRAGYDARFVFSTVETMVGLGARGHLARAALVHSTLASVLGPDTVGAGFVIDADGPRVVATAGSVGRGVNQVMELCRWAHSLFGVIGFVDDQTRVAQGVWNRECAVVTWWDASAHYVARCDTRAAATLLLSRIERREEELAA